MVLGRAFAGTVRRRDPRFEDRSALGGGLLGSAAARPAVARALLRSLRRPPVPVPVRARQREEAPIPGRGGGEEGAHDRRIDECRDGRTERVAVNCSANGVGSSVAHAKTAHITDCRHEADDDADQPARSRGQEAADEDPADGREDDEIGEQKAVTMSFAPVTAVAIVAATVISTGIQMAFVWTAIQGAPRCPRGHGPAGSTVGTHREATRSGGSRGRLPCAGVRTASGGRRCAAASSVSPVSGSVASVAR